MALELTLPWPSPKLSPNARHHWAEVMGEKKAYRTACYVTASQPTMSFHGVPVVGQLALAMPNTRISLSIEFQPPDRRRYDRDNLVARLKAGLDGVAQALGVDDHQFDLAEITVSDPIPGGAVVLRLCQAASSRCKAQGQVAQGGP